MHRCSLPERTRRRLAMSLIETAIAIGIVSFCLVSIIGLFPTMLQTVRESRTSALAQRIFQTVARDLREVPLSPSAERQYDFDEEGFLVGMEPDRPGTIMRGGETRFEARVTNSSVGTFPNGIANSNATVAVVVLMDQVTKRQLIQRPIWNEY